MNDSAPDFKPTNTNPKPKVNITMNKPLIMTNTQTSKNTVSDRQPHGRQFFKAIQQFIKDKQGKTDSVYQIQQLKRQIKQKYFSVSAIQEEKKQIAAKIFYFPSFGIIKQIQTYFDKQYEGIIFKCVSLRHGDLYVLKQQITDQQVKLQIDHVMESVISWGPFYFDIKKLQQYAQIKTGNTIEKKYLLTDLQMLIQIGQSIDVKYKNVSISPSQFKNNYLREMAIQHLRKKATQIYFAFIKEKKIMF